MINLTQNCGDIQTLGGGGGGGGQHETNQTIIFLNFSRFFRLREPTDSRKV